MTMKKLIDEISVIPGVTGSCIFDKTEGPLCTDSAANLATDLLQTVGTYLIRLLKMGKMTGFDVGSTHFRFDSCTVVGLPLESEAILLTICDNRANSSLVATTAGMLAAEMREELEREIVAGNQLDHALPPDSGVENLENDQVDTDIQTYLDQIEEALALTIGPIAGLVIHDYVNKWRQGGPAVSIRLFELVEMLTEEIDDLPLVAEFKSRVKGII